MLVACIQRIANVQGELGSSGCPLLLEKIAMKNTQTQVLKKTSLVSLK